jgi:hypothetical protein
MAIADLFSTSFIFSLLIIIVLLGVLYAYFNYKLSEQDHKISSMFGLVRSMADEMSYLRKLTNNNNNEQSINLEYATQLLQPKHENNDIELISVSDEDEDDEDDDYEDEDDECEDDEDEDDEDEEDEDEDTKYSDDNDNDINDNIEGGFNNDNVLTLAEELNEIKTIHLEEPIELNCNFEAVDLNFTSVEQEDLVDANKINFLEEVHSENSNINVSELSVKQDFKKLPLNKLREVIVEKGLIVDASKLKKNEILKMLGEESSF